MPRYVIVDLDEQIFMECDTRPEARNAPEPLQSFELSDEIGISGLLYWARDAAGNTTVLTSAEAAVHWAAGRPGISIDILVADSIRLNGIQKHIDTAA